MFKFNLKKAAISIALRWSYVFSFAYPFRKGFLILLLIGGTVFSCGFAFTSFSFEQLQFVLGLTILFAVFFLICWISEKFFEYKLKKPNLKIRLAELPANQSKFNLAEFLSFESASAIDQLMDSGISRINSTSLFLSSLSNNYKINFIFSHLFLNINDVRQGVESYLNSMPSDGDEGEYSQSFQDAILKSIEIAVKRNHLRIEIEDLLLALAYIDPAFKKILIEFDLKRDDIDNMGWWLDNLERRREKKMRFWDYDNLAVKGSLAKTWTAGYTINLDKFSFDWTDRLKKFLPETIGYGKEINLLERILSGTGINNALLIGQAGSGMDSIINALVRKSILGETISDLNFKRVVELDMTSLLSSIKSLDEVESTLNNIFKEVIFAGNIILVIKNLHNYIGQPDNKPGIIDISGIISSFLNMPQFHFIGITTFEGLHENIERNSSILSLFERIEVGELGEKETIMILEDASLEIERKYEITVPYPAIREIMNLAKRYMTASAFPEKGLKVLDDVAVYVSESTKDRVILPKHVAKVMTEKTEIPIGEIQSKEKSILLHLEDLIHKRIIDQDEAVKEVSEAMRRARSEITIRKGPIGAFIFLGPTGVGKTETAKALAEFYFGSEEKIIRLDMSEFQSANDIPRLIGTREAPGLLTTAVKEDPFSVVLLDEIEKAHLNIRNIFLSVLDEGYIKDGVGT
ncbi:MAG: AAA family ATPase, partial [Candidatus Nealsonbacteria bacterium]|nr:AAA family ATPase [Candidatus Nealsonbacteria bacterium]